MDRKQMLWICFFIFPCDFTQGALSLKSYDVDRNGVSVSGISAGGAFAVQMHVAYSAQIMGCGSIATPGPYYCARGSVLGAINTCMNFPIAIDVPTLQEDTAGAEAGGYIDPTSNLRGSKVYVYHGTEDYTVSPGASDKLVEYYNSYSVDLLSELSLEAGHAFPTLSYGNPCDSSYLPFINMCAYDGAFTLLNHIYGNLRRPGSNTQLNGQFMEFDQTEFAGTSWSFDPAGGYIYIPSGCSLSKKQAQRETEEQNNKSQKNEECAVDISDREACGRQGISQNQCLQEGCCWELELPYFCFRKNPEAERCLSVAPGDREECGFSGITEDQCGERNCCWKEELPYFCYNKYSASSTTPAQPATTTNPPSEQCKLHVAFHGCSQGREDIGDVFARNAGYLEVAEENNIIVLFPQIISALGYNPNGCYDWWGYEDEDYAIQTGTQISAVKAMIDRIIG